jgi:hypothetical protein
LYDKVEIRSVNSLIFGVISAGYLLKIKFVFCDTINQANV